MSEIKKAVVVFEYDPELIKHMPTSPNGSPQFSWLIEHIKGITKAETMAYDYQVEKAADYFRKTLDEFLENRGWISEHESD